jgi:hypothetical protein
MRILSNTLKGLAAIALIAASPILIVFIVPFGFGIASDLLNAAGTPAALAATIAICTAALAWTRYRSRLSRIAMPEHEPARSLG